MATNEEILNPIVLIVPTMISGALVAGMTAIPKGSLFMSGAKLYVATASGTVERITSA